MNGVAAPRADDVRFNRGSAVLLCAIGVVAMLAFARFVDLRALNIPFHDDILDVLDFILRFRQAEGWREQAGVWFAQYNDHRTTFPRLIYLLSLRLEGEIDFHTLSLLANSALPLLVLLYVCWAPRELRVPVFAVAALLLCQPRAFDFVAWPMSALSFYFVCVHAFAALLLLEQPRPARFALALLFGCAATFSLSSGQFVWPVGAALLAGETWRGRRESLPWLVAWLVLGALAVMLFHAGFDNPNALSKLAGFAWRTPLHHAQYFLALLGSALAFGSVNVAMIAGAGALLVLASLSTGIARPGRHSLCFFAWFLVLGTLAVALGRAPYSAVDYALSPRYSVASLNLFAALLFLQAQHNTLLRGIWRMPVAVVAAAFCLLCYNFYTPLLHGYLQARIARFNQGDFPVYGYPLPSTNAIVATAIAEGIYHPPSRPLRLSFVAGGASPQAH